MWLEKISSLFWSFLSLIRIFCHGRHYNCIIMKGQFYQQNIFVVLLLTRSSRKLSKKYLIPKLNSIRGLELTVSRWSRESVGYIPLHFISPGAICAQLFVDVDFYHFLSKIWARCVTRAGYSPTWGLSPDSSLDWLSCPTRGRRQGVITIQYTAWRCYIMFLWLGGQTMLFLWESCH